MSWVGGELTNSKKLGCVTLTSVFRRPHTRSTRHARAPSVCSQQVVLEKYLCVIWNFHFMYVNLNYNNLYLAVSWISYTFKRCRSLPTFCKGLLPPSSGRSSLKYQLTYTTLYSARISGSANIILAVRAWNLIQKKYLFPGTRRAFELSRRKFHSTSGTQQAPKSKLAIVFQVG